VGRPGPKVPGSPDLGTLPAQYRQTPSYPLLQSLPDPILSLEISPQRSSEALSSGFRAFKTPALSAPPPHFLPSPGAPLVPSGSLRPCSHPWFHTPRPSYDHKPIPRNNWHSDSGSTLTGAAFWTFPDRLTPPHGGPNPFSLLYLQMEGQTHATSPTIRLPETTRRQSKSPAPRTATTAAGSRSSKGSKPCGPNYQPISPENPAAGAGQNRKRPVAVADSLPLLGIETLKEVHGYGVTHDSSTPSGRSNDVDLYTYMCVVNTQNRTSGCNPFVGLLCVQDY
jgi:hypothetical protein